MNADMMRERNKYSESYTAPSYCPKRVPRLFQVHVGAVVGFTSFVSSCMLECDSADASKFPQG